MNKSYDGSIMDDDIAVAIHHFDVIYLMTWGEERGRWENRHDRSRNREGNGQVPTGEEVAPNYGSSGEFVSKKKGGLGRVPRESEQQSLVEVREWRVVW